MAMKEINNNEKEETDNNKNNSIRETKPNFLVPPLTISTSDNVVAQPSSENPKLIITPDLPEKSTDLESTDKASSQIRYNINIIQEKTEVPKSPVSKKKQNAMLLSLNTIIPASTSNVNTSETELSPSGSKKPNYVIKNIFNTSHSPTPERESFYKRGSFSKNAISPIQQYFNEASPRALKPHDTSLYDQAKTPERDGNDRSFGGGDHENDHYGLRRNRSFNFSNNGGNGDNGEDFNLNDGLIIDNLNPNNQIDDGFDTNNNGNNGITPLENNVIANVLQFQNSPKRSDSQNNNNFMNINNVGINKLNSFHKGALSPINNKSFNIPNTNQYDSNSNGEEDILNVCRNPAQFNQPIQKKNNMKYHMNNNNSNNYDMGYQQNYPMNGNNLNTNNQLNQPRYQNIYNNQPNNYSQFSQYNYNQKFLGPNYPAVYQQPQLYMNQNPNHNMVPIQQISQIPQIPQMGQMPIPQMGQIPQLQQIQPVPPLVPNQKFPINSNPQIQQGMNGKQPNNQKTNRRIVNSSNLYKLDNNEIAKQSHNLAKDQIGCRFLQKKVEEDTKFALSSIYPIILDHLLDTINDQFGNYLIQKFFEYLSNEELFQFLKMISPSFANIGINQYGTRVIQKIMDYIKKDSDQQLYETFIDLIIPNIVLFSNDINGCHIVQKILLTKNFDNAFAYKEMDESIEKIANHKNGCCFLQKCTEKLKGNDLENILDSINKKAKLLIVDQYGNYVIQHVMKINGAKRNLAIFNILIENLPFYSNQKFSSNVIEKFFIFEDMKNAIVNQLLIPEIMKEMLFDSFGNYVVQKAIANTSKESQMKLLYLIAPLMEELKNLNFGVKLYHKLTVQYPMLLSIMMTMHNNKLSNENFVN